MTTIVYSHKEGVIACDSRTVSGGIIVSDDSKKFSIINGEHYFISGYTPDGDDLIRFYLGEEVNRTKYECAVMYTKNGKVFLMSYEDEFSTWELFCDRCIGSGGDFALAALDYGKSAKEAVKYAMTRDIYTGGTVREFLVR